MPTFEEGRHPGDFIMSEANGRLSRDNIWMAEGQVLEAGTVLGAVESGGGRTYSALDLSAHDGRQEAQAILFASIDTTDGANVAVAYTRSTEIIGGNLIWPDGITSMQKAFAIAQLLAKGQVIR